MKRPVVLTVEDYGQLELHVPHTAEVLDVRPAGENLKVLLRYLDRSHDGREQDVFIPARVFPQSLTGRFFAACGFDVSVGSSIRPKDAKGKWVKITFRRSGGGDVVVDCFESVSPEVNHVPDTQSKDSLFA